MDLRRENAAHQNPAQFDLRWRHAPGRRLGWKSVDIDIRDFVLDVVGSMRMQLKAGGFVGGYLHGSLATDSFYRGKSDIDMSFVVEMPMSPDEMTAAAGELVRLSDRRPITGDIEVTVHRRADISEFRQPVPFEVHYGEAHKSAIKAGDYDHVMGGSDSDAAAHLFNIQRSGVALAGEPIADVFGPVPVSAFREAVRDDIDWILSENNILTTPIYGILNSCRWLANESEGWESPASKDAAGEWALAHLPEEYRPTIAQTLCCYRSEEPVDPGVRRTDGHAWDQEEILAFRDYVKSQLDG